MNFEDPYCQSALLEISISANEHSELISTNTLPVVLADFEKYLYDTFRERLGDPYRPVFNATGKLYDFVWNRNNLRGSVGFNFDNRGIVKNVTFFTQRYRSSVSSTFSQKKKNMFNGKKKKTCVSECL